MDCNLSLEEMEREAYQRGDLASAAAIQRAIKLPWGRQDKFNWQMRLGKSATDALLIAEES